MLWLKKNQNPERNHSLLDTKHPPCTFLHTYSSGQAEGLLAWIKALVTDSMYISPPALGGTSPLPFPSGPICPVSFPPWAMKGTGAGLEGMVWLEHRAGRRQTGRELELGKGEAREGQESKSIGRKARWWQSHGRPRAVMLTEDRCTGLGWGECPPSCPG